MFKSKQKTICIVSLIILGFLFFYKTISFGFFNLDDPILITENRALLNFDFKKLLTNYYIGLFHPLTTLSFTLDWWLGGGKPWMFHLSNFIFHLLGTLILLKVSLKFWPKKILLCFLISLTFLLHPLKAESVAWITERKDVLSGLFLWLTIYCYLIYLGHHKLRYYILANFAFLCALSSKVSVVPLPLFLLVVDWYRSRKFKFSFLVNKAPFFLLSLTFGVLNVLEQVRFRKDLDLPPKNYTDLFYQLQFYIEKFIFPWNLRAWYSPEYLNSNALGITSIAFIGLLTIVIIRSSTVHRKDLALGFALFGLFLFPNIKIIPPGDANLVNDRYMYVALTGLTFAFFPFLLHLIKELWKAGRQLSSFAISLSFASLLVQWLSLMYLQIPYWRNPVTTWQRAARLEPTSVMVAGKLGKALLSAGRHTEAISYLQKSKGTVEDIANLGNTLIQAHRIEDAKNLILKGLKIYPNHSALLNMLGVLRLGKREYDEAHALFTQALQNLKNESSTRLRVMILNNLGLVNLQLGLYSEAESFFKQALSSSGNNSEIIYNLGHVLLKQNRLAEAKSALFQVLTLNPNFAEIYNNIGFVFYQEKNFVEARTWFNRALEIDPNLELAKNNIIAMDREKH